jgi:parallel beta-helix repeat protein
LDTISPATPTLHNIVSPTNICTQLLSGNKEINSSIWVNGVEVIPINSETVWSYNFELAEGENNLSIISKDFAGNESNEVNTFIILDTTAPAIPSLKSVASPTNISSQILSGTKETGSLIIINGAEVVPLDSSTEWSYSYNLSEGTNNISITSRDAAGNESSAVTAIIILDTGAPEAPTIDVILSPTSVSPQILSGTKEINTSIWINNIEIIPINSSSTWTYDFNLSEGENNISITSQDLAGNESGKATVKIILDTILPATPALNEVITPTNISIQVLSGSKEANSSILINDTEVVSINSSTNWSYSYNLSEGTNNISVTSRDGAGNESSAVTTTIEYDPNIYVDAAANATETEDGTKTHPFDTITEGIVAVAPGKSVIIAAGNYNEQLFISKEITLQGASRDNTYITGSDLTGNLITLEADYVTITGFTIDGASSTAKGIYFDSCSSINVNNNIIQNNISYGINYSNSSPAIENNDIKNNSYSGVDVGTGGAGIVRNNSIIFNKYGIRTCGDSSPEITRNNISSNNIGIYCRESATPIISYNTISNNTGYGILIDNISGNLVNPDIGGGDGQSDGQNKITGNSIHGVSNKTAHNIYAKYNWWGDVAGPKYPNNPDGNAALLSDWAYWSKTGANIIFEPYLTAEP